MSQIIAKGEEIFNIKTLKIKEMGIIDAQKAFL